MKHDGQYAGPLLAQSRDSWTITAVHLAHLSVMRAGVVLRVCHLEPGTGGALQGGLWCVNMSFIKPDRMRATWQPGKSNDVTLEELNQGKKRLLEKL